MRNGCPSQGPANCLPSGPWQLLEELVERLEESWQRGQRPGLAEFLPANSALPEAVLAELVLTDLECRSRQERWRGRKNISGNFRSCRRTGNGCSS